MLTTYSISAPRSSAWPILKHRRQWKSSVFPAAIFAFFVQARAFKHAAFLTWIPIDLTAALGVITAIFMVTQLRNLRRSTEITIGAAFFFVLLISAFGAGISDYATSKSTLLFTSTALLFFAPFLTVGTSRQRIAFTTIVAGVGGVIALGVLIALSIGSGDTRQDPFNANPIWAARAISAGIVVLVMRLIYRKIPLVVALPMIVAMSIAVVATGSRGPAIAALLGLTVGLTVTSLRDRTLSRRALAAGGLAVLVTSAVLFLAPEPQVARYAALASGDVDVSGQIRIDLLSASFEAALDYPMGSGLGTFKESLQDPSLRYMAEYPHNVILEILIEAGWVAAALFLTLLFTGVRRLARAPVGLATATFLSLFVYTFFTAMTSGDVNANRLFIAVLAITLAAKPGSWAPDWQR